MDNISQNEKKEEKPGAAQGFDLSKIYVWLRGIESKVNNLRREFDIMKTDSSHKHEKLNKEFKTINADLMELKREQEKTGEKMDLIIKELKVTAGKEELMTLKKYIDLWNPMNFVTQRDVERVVEEKMGNKPSSPVVVKKKQMNNKI